MTLFLCLVSLVFAFINLVRLNQHSEKLRECIKRMDDINKQVQESIQKAETTKMKRKW